MKKAVIIGVLACFLFACKQQNKDDIQDNSEVLAVVGNQPITARFFEAYLGATGVQNPDASQRAKYLDELITEMTLAHYAETQNIALSEDQKLSLRYLHMRSLANSALQHYLKQNPLTEEEIQNEYERVKAQTGGVEYRVHHLLYKDEVQAVRSLDAIRAGTDYAELEAQYLQDNAGINNIGDLGWVNLNQVPESFRAVLPGMQKNSVYPQVLVSQFGAHVLYLEDVRAFEPPSLESVREGISSALKNRLMSKFRQLTRAKANVVIKDS